MQKRDGQLNHRIVAEELTGTYDDLGLRCERDAFDTLFDHAPDKLAVVKRVSVFSMLNAYKIVFVILVSVYNISCLFSYLSILSICTNIADEYWQIQQDLWLSSFRFILCTINIT